VADLWLTKSDAADLLGREQAFIRDQVIPRLTLEEKRKLSARGSPWSLLARGVVRAYVEWLSESETGDPAAWGAANSPALERQREARAKLLELDLAERRQQLMSVELFRSVTVQAFGEVRQFAERQIKAHGNGTADDWRQVVERFGRLIESATREAIDTDGAGAVPVAGDATGAAASAVD
jgi:hypothetical protein